MSRDYKIDSNDEPTVVEFPEVETVQAQAARWLSVLDSDDPPREKVEAFKQWINQDDTHRAEFESLVSFWDELNILTEVVPPRKKSNLSEAGVDKSERSWLKRSYAVGLAFTSLVAVTLTFIVHVGQPTPMIYTTAIGEQKTVELPDHTTVLLNTNSRMEVDYDDTRRGVRLVRGEALFNVHHNPRRPFEVYAGGGTVRAVGTAFAVHLREKDVEVVVTEGIVEIDKAPPPERLPNTLLKAPNAGSATPGNPSAEPRTNKTPSANTRVKVTAGSQATYDKDNYKEVILAEIKKIEDKLAWREGILAFDREPLENVVAEVSRYTSTKFIIPEQQVREMIVGGIFKVGDTESMFEALQLSFGIHAEKVSDNVVYLVRMEDNQ